MIFKRTADLLQEKERQLAELEGKSIQAVQMVQSTMDNLLSVNSSIKATMDEIDTYVQRLNDTRNSLSSTHSKNERIMQNFSKLLCIE